MESTTLHQSVVAHPYDEKQLRPVTFEVDGEVDKLIISYRFSEGNVVDLGLARGDEIIGWSGGARKELVISESFATPGYLRTPISNGTWSVLLGLYKIRGECRIDIDITLQRKTSRWLTGDTHVHSEHSDGKLSVEALIERAMGLNFDFLCLTDHNTTSQNRVIAGMNAPLTLIPGMELTTDRGHVNFLGLTQPVERFLPHFSEQDITAKMDEARRNGARIGINHPFCHYCPWMLPFRGHDWLELWNGPWDATGNEMTFQYWLQLLYDGIKVPVTAGSDFHKEKGQILPRISVRTRSAEREDILRGLERGQSYLQSDSDTRLNRFVMGDAGIGDTSDSALLQVNLDTRPDNQVLLYTQKKIYLLNNRNGHINQEVDCSDSAFAFLRVNREQTAQLITNPIFRE